MTVGEVKDADAPPGKEFNTPPRKTQVDDVANVTTNYKIPNSSAKLITEKAELNEFHEAVAQRVSEYDAADDGGQILVSVISGSQGANREVECSHKEFGECQSARGRRP